MKTRTIRYILVLLGIFSLGKAVVAQTVVTQSTLQGEHIWTLGGSPYYIQGDITIDEEANLLIESGCVVIFEGKYAINVAGRLSLSGWTQTIHLQGQDLGNGKHILWRGIQPASASAIISLVHADIQDAEVAVNFTGYAFQTLGPELYCNEVNFENNLTALKTGAQGSKFIIQHSKFLNNLNGIVGNYTSIDSFPTYNQLDISTSTFDGNETAIQSAYCSIEACQFENNATAIKDGLYSTVDSSGFKNNELAISGYGLKIERCIFFLNDKAIVHTGRNLTRDKVLRNSIIRSNNFESNKEALFLEDGAMIDEMSCNLFTKNDLALVLPDSLYNMGNTAFRVERNIFIQNNLAIRILQLAGTGTPAPGSGLKAVNFLYNILALDFIIIDQTSPNNLNFFHNYILSPERFFTDLRVVDGFDVPGLGMINYTVSGDTSKVNDFITVNKIEDVIRHTNYDTALISGTTYTFEMCASMPGNVLNIAPPEEGIAISVFPNPFTQLLHLEWEDERIIDFLLYNMTGQEIPLRSTQGISSPAQLDLGHLNPGIYLLRATSGNEVRSFKLIKN